MASINSLLRVRLTFIPYSKRRGFRFKIAVVIIRFGCWLGSGFVGRIEVGP